MDLQFTPSRTSIWDQFFLGARACLPVAVSVSAYGLVWGVLAKQAGLTTLEVLLTSGLVFAGSAQFVALTLWTPTPSALPISALVVAVMIVNLRYVLLTATLRPLFERTSNFGGAWRMFLVTDENWAMTIAEMARGRGTSAFLLGGGVLVYSVWLASTLGGRLLGAAIDDPTKYGLDFAFTATFLALLLGMWRGKADILPWLVAAVVAIASAKLLGGSWYILIGGLAGSFVGAIIQTRNPVRHADLA